MCQRQWKLKYVKKDFILYKSQENSNQNLGFFACCIQKKIHIYWKFTKIICSNGTWDWHISPLFVTIFWLEILCFLSLTFYLQFDLCSMLIVCVYSFQQFTSESILYGIRVRGCHFTNKTTFQPNNFILYHFRKCI